MVRSARGYGGEQAIALSGEPDSPLDHGRLMLWRTAVADLAASKFAAFINVFYQRFEASPKIAPAIHTLPLAWTAGAALLL